MTRICYSLGQDCESPCSPSLKTHEANKHTFPLSGEGGKYLCEK